MADNRDILNTLIAEALGEGPEGMRRVAETINNRALIRGLTPEQVVTQPNQYTGYSHPGPAAVRAMSDPAAISAAEAAWQLAQQPGDPTNGADHYFNPNVVRPSWAQSMTPTGDYGGHSFYSSQAVPRQTPVAPTPAAQSQGLSALRASTSPSGGNTALQSALARLATTKAERTSAAFNGDPGTRVPIDMVQSLPTKAIPAAAPISDKARAAGSAARRDLTYPGQINASVANASRSDPTLAAALQAKVNVGKAPAIRSVQSVPMPPISQTPAKAAVIPPARPISLTPVRATTPVSRPVSLTPRANDIGAMPSAASLGNMFKVAKLPSASQLAASTGLRVPAPVPSASGTTLANKPNERLPVGHPVDINGTLQSQIKAQGIQTPILAASAPRVAPLPASRDQMNIARNGLTAAVPGARIAQALIAPQPVPQPIMSVVVNGGNPIARALSAVQQSPEWQRVTGTEPRYTDNGNGSRTSASGGVYYDRNYK